MYHETTDPRGRSILNTFSLNGIQKIYFFDKSTGLNKTEGSQCFTFILDEIKYNSLISLEKPIFS